MFTGLVEQAQAQRSPAERFIDRFARWYTPAVVALAFCVAFYRSGFLVSRSWTMQMGLLAAFIVDSHC